MNDNKIKSLDSIRGLAALSVLLFHCYTLAYSFQQQINAIIKYLDFPWNTPLVLIVNFLTSGRSAVILFFVLSGFVLTLSLLNHKQSYKKFLLSRFFRIYPVLFLSVVISYGLHYVIGNNIIPPFVHPNWYQFHIAVPISLAFQDLIGHLALTGITPNHIYLDTPLWSLVHEMRIYIIFPLIVLLLSVKNKPAIFLMLGLIISIMGEFISDFLIMNKSVNKPHGFPEETLLYSLMKTMYFLVFFVAGIFTAINRDRISMLVNKLPSITKIFLAIIAVVFLIYYDSGYTIFVDYLRGIGAVMLISLAFSWRSFAKFLEITVFLWLGKISYSLYLVHWPIIYSISELYGNTLPLSEIIPIIIILSLIFAELMSRFVEYPLINLGRKLLSKIQ